MNKKLIAVILCLSILFTSFVSPEQIAAKKSKLKLNKKKVTMYVGKTVLLKVKGTKQKVKWKSNRRKIAAVSQKGKVTAKKKGSAKITAKVGKKKLVCQVTVRNRAVLVDDADQADGSVDQGSSDVSAAPGASAKTSFNPSGGDVTATVTPSDFWGTVTKKPDHTGDTDTSKPQETAAADTSKPQETTAADTSKPQETTAADTSKPQETTAADTSKPQETTATNTTKPTAAAANTTKPTAAATNATKPTTAAANTTKPTAAATNTTKPTAAAANTTKPTAAATNATKPTTAAANTTKPTAAVTDIPQPTVAAGEIEEPLPLVPTIGQASFDDGADGFKAQGNASIEVADGGYEGKCLQISNRETASDGVVYAAGEEVTAGESYTVQGYVKTASGDGTLKCMYRTGDGADDIHELVAVSTSDDGWTKFMGTITVPDGFEKLDIWFELEDSTEAFYIDEVNILQIISIKDTFDHIFWKTGTCIRPDQMRDPEIMAYVRKHYSSITLENDMKPDALLPGWLAPIDTKTARGKTGDYVIPDNYKEGTVPNLNYGTVDEMLRIAKENGLKLRYHVLLWHAQTPEWFFKENYSQDENAAYVSEDTMDARMEMYIRSVIHHVYTVNGGAYRDVVYAWDVANEYFSNTPDKNWSAVYGNREDKWGNHPAFIKRAFELAHEELETLSLADSVSLFYNDFNTYMTTDKIIDMIHYFNSDKKVCSGVGMQSHIGVDAPSIDSYVNTVQRFIEEGFEVQITELDVACVNTKKPEAEQDIPALYEKQAEHVKELTEKLVDLQRSTGYRITGLTWWGMYDGMSWVKASHALMFHDELNEAKPSYFAFMDAAASTMNKPAPTPPPLYKYDFSDEDSYGIEGPDQASHVLNEDGSITLTFRGGGAYDFFLPKSEWDGVDYKSIVLTYTSQGGNLNHALYDVNAVGKEDLGKGKHPYWSGQIQNTQGEEKKLILNVTNDCIGKCIRGLQIFTQTANVTITIKSMIFCGKANPTKYDLDPSLNPPVKPTPAPTATPTASPTVTPTETPTAVPTATPLDVSVPSGYTSRNESVAGTVEDITYDSTVIKEGGTVRRKAKVVLPKGYTEDKEYPVVYMQHGIFGNETTLYGDGTQYVVWNAIANGDAEEMIVVFPNACANEEGKGDGFNLEHYSAYDNFINDLEQCLMPYINEHYSTLTGRENTAICGYSMGGRVSLHIGFTLQDKFGYIGGFCPAFGILEYENMSVHEDGLFTPETFTLQEKYMNDTLVLIAAGPKDDTVKAEPKRYSDTLTANGVPHIYYETMGGEDEKGDGGHGQDVYKHGLYNFLTRIFNHSAAGKPSPSPTPGITVTAPPEYTIDFKADLKQESGYNATQNVLEDGTADITFGNLEGVHYILPNTAEMKAAKYRYVTVTYEGTGDEVEVWLYNGELDLGVESVSGLDDKKNRSKVSLVATTGGTTSVTYSFADEQPKGEFFRGIQLFHRPGSGASMTVKSIVFSKNMPVADGWTSLPLSGISDGTKGDAEVTLNGMDLVTVPLPQKLEGKGKKVEVTVNGTLAESSDGFRIWLSQGIGTASDQYYFTKGNGVGFGGQGDGDLKFKTGPFSITCVLTVGNNNQLEQADNLLLKAPVHLGKLKGVTITDIQVREVEE